MSIIRKVKAVERVFKSLEEEIADVKHHTGLQCIAGCGRCCVKPDIYASPLEFLPLAFYWFKNGAATQMLELLEQERSPICFNYRPLSVGDQVNGACHNYVHRGLICRLFGYAASRDKNGELKLVTCKTIKEQFPREYGNANRWIEEKEYVPVVSDYYKRLIQIDFRLANQSLPVNEAMREALEEVMHYYAYRPFNWGKKAG